MAETLESPQVLFRDREDQKRCEGFIKHTPGPWVMYTYDAGKAGTMFMVAQEFSSLGPHMGMNVCRLNVASRYTSHLDGDAHLIAAAPDLLEACEELLSSPLLLNLPIRDRVEAAVAKANGKL